MSIEGVYLNKINAIYNKPTANIIFKCKNQKAFSLRSEQDVHSCHFIQYSLEVLATPIRKEKEIKGIQIGKEEAKLSLSANDMILYIENPKDTIRKLLKLINEFSKVTR